MLSLPLLLYGVSAQIRCVSRVFLTRTEIRASMNLPWRCSLQWCTATLVNLLSTHTQRKEISVELTGGLMNFPFLFVLIRAERELFHTVLEAIWTLPRQLSGFLLLGWLSSCFSEGRGDSIALYQRDEMGTFGLVGSLGTVTTTNKRIVKFVSFDWWQMMWGAISQVGLDTSSSRNSVLLPVLFPTAASADLAQKFLLEEATVRHEVFLLVLNQVFWRVWANTKRLAESLLLDFPLDTCL